VSTAGLRIERFRPEDQRLVRDLILAGLEERWGAIDPSLNPDLDDIALAYDDSTVLVAWSAGEVVGAGILVPRGDGMREIVRMSVATAHRRRGIGRRVLTELVEIAEREAARRVVLETTATWQEAIELYAAFGFQLSHVAEGAFGPNAYFFLDLPLQPVVSSSDG
jgi:ribosomal protein S18 acetylase RimI-like enzyme